MSYCATLLEWFNSFLEGVCMKSFLLVVLLLIPSVCFSELDNVTKYLLNEPATLHDLGITRVNNRFLNFFKDINYNNINSLSFVNCDYDFKNDIYILKVVIYANSNFENNDIKPMIKTLDIDLKSNIGLIPDIKSKTYKPIYGEASMLGLFFSHSGTRTENEPNSLYKMLDDKFYIHYIFVNPTKNHKDKENTNCFNKLYEQKLSCED